MWHPHLLQSHQTVKILRVAAKFPQILALLSFMLLNPVTLPVQ